MDNSMINSMSQYNRRNEREREIKMIHQVLQPIYHSPTSTTIEEINGTEAKVCNNTITQAIGGGGG